MNENENVIQHDQISSMPGDDLPNGARILMNRWYMASKTGQHGIVLAVKGGRHHPFVTWERTVEVATTATGFPYQIDQCFWGHYHSSLGDALVDFEDRVEARTHEKANYATMKKRGEIDGANAAEWYLQDILQSALGVVALKRIIDGIDDGDPQILDALPSPDFSGQFADEKKWQDVLLEEGLIERWEDIPDDGWPEMAEAYDDGWQEGLQDRIHLAYREHSIRVES